MTTTEGTVFYLRAEVANVMAGTGATGSIVLKVVAPALVIGTSLRHAIDPLQLLDRWSQ